jgi:hypothetical protein
MEISFLFVLCLLCLIFFIWMNQFCRSFNKSVIGMEKFQNMIIFLSKDQLYEFLQKNEDNYYQRFFDLDFKARKINSIEDYQPYIQQAVSNGDNIVKEKVLKGIQKADAFFANLDLEYFDGKKINQIPWKIGFIKNKLYENGLPHTRKDIIILNQEKVKNSNLHNLIKTLIHEKIHVYQKIYTNDVEKYIHLKKFKKIKKRDAFDQIRANPDLDDFIYQDEFHNTYKALYNKQPSSIEDITYYPQNNQSYEHPNEKMAIDIEYMYKG